MWSAHKRELERIHRELRELVDQQDRLMLLLETVHKLVLVTSRHFSYPVVGDAVLMPLPPVDDLETPQESERQAGLSTEISTKK